MRTERQFIVDEKGRAKSVVLTIDVNFGGDVDVRSGDGRDDVQLEDLNIDDDLDVDGGDDRDDLFYCGYLDVDGFEYVAY